MSPADGLGRRALVGAALGALEGLYRSAEDLAGKAARLAPLEEGTLRGSMTVVLVVNGRRFEGAGGLAAARSFVAAAPGQGIPLSMAAEVAANTIYAAYQHEELRLHHEEGQAKYLEEPLTANADRYGRIIALAAQRGATLG